MLTVMCVLVATAPLALVFGSLAWANRWERRRCEVRIRQIALTDAIHERIGAAASPVVRRLRRGWRVSVAVPFGRPAVTEALLAIVRESFARGGRRDGLAEIVLTRQTDTPPATLRADRDVPRESLTCT